MQRSIDEMIEFFLFEKGEDIKINGVLQRALLLDAVDKINQGADKVIHCKAGIKTGDVIEYNGQKYILTSQIDKNVNSYSGKITQCNYSIAFNFNGNVKWFDALVETKAMDIESNQYISLPAGKVKVSLQDNADSRDIVLGKRFINTGRTFEVLGIDKARKGLIILTCNLTSTNSKDDLIDEIADRWQYEIVHTYALSVDNGASMKVPLNNTAQLNITVIDNGSAMNPNPALTYISSDPSVVIVDNTGKLIGINNGTAIVTCLMTYKNIVKASVDITVVESVSRIYTINVAGCTTVLLGQSKSYIAHFYDNGMEVYDKSAVWTIRNQDGTNISAYAAITTSSGNGATVMASSNTSHINKYVILKAMLSDDSTVFKEFTIQVKSLI